MENLAETLVCAPINPIIISLGDSSSDSMDSETESDWITNFTKSKSFSSVWIHSAVVYGLWYPRVTGVRIKSMKCKP